MSYIGYSNGKTYKVFKVASYNPNIGLVEVEGWLFLCWCTFERIEEIKEA